jgi:hypothetical protein
MCKRCPTATPVGTTEIEGYELLFRGGVANVEVRDDSTVPVLIWDIQPNDEDALDIYEGFPKLYVKQDIELELNGENVTAMAYIMTPGRAAGLPSKSYLNTIAQGYRTAGFDIGVLKEALERTREIQSEEQNQQSQFNMKWW